MVSEAVEEVLNLVDKATEKFKEIAGDDVVTLFDGKSCNCYVAKLNICKTLANSHAQGRTDGLGRTQIGGRRCSCRNFRCKHVRSRSNIWNWYRWGRPTAGLEHFVVLF